MSQLDFESYTTQIISDNTMNNSLWPMMQPIIDDSHKGNASTMAQLFLKLGVLYWRRGNFDRSEQLLSKAREISADMQDIPFLAQCFVGLALVKTHLKKIEDAIDAYQQAIRFDPENFHLWNNLGNLYLQHNQSDKALMAFKQSIHGNSNDAIAWSGLANVYYQNGEVDEAIRAYKRAIELMQNADFEQTGKSSPKLNKQFTLQWLHLATLYTKKYQYQKAIDAYQKVLEFDSGNAKVWLELGTLYIKVKAYEDSIEALSKAVEQNPKHGEAYLNLAYAYTKVGKHKDSIPLYMKSIEWLPSQQEKKLASHLMEEAIRIVKKNNSVKIYAGMDEASTSSSYHNEITWFYFKYNEEISVINLPCSAYDLRKLTKRTANKFTNSGQQIDKGERDMPYILPLSSPENTQGKSENTFTHSRDQEIKNIASSWNDKGNTYFNNQTYEEAIIAYNKAIEIDPTFGQPKNNLALIYFMQGQYDKAILLYQDSIDLLVTDQEKAIAWNGLGNVYRRIKDYESARIAYQSASKLDQRNGGVYDNTIVDEASKKYKTADFWNELGKLFFKTGAYERATSAFQKAIQLEPFSGRSYGYLARALTAQGQYKEAVSLYHKSIDLIPNDKEKANAWNRLGDVNRKLNDYDNALKAYQNATALSNDKFSLLSRTRLSLLSNCTAK